MNFSAFSSPVGTLKINLCPAKHSSLLGKIVAMSIDSELRFNRVWRWPRCPRIPESLNNQNLWRNVKTKEFEMCTYIPHSVPLNSTWLAGHCRFSVSRFPLAIPEISAMAIQTRKVEKKSLVNILIVGWQVMYLRFGLPFLYQKYNPKGSENKRLSNWSRRYSHFFLINDELIQLIIFISHPEVSTSSSSWLESRIDSGISYQFKNSLVKDFWKEKNLRLRFFSFQKSISPRIPLYARACPNGYWMYK